MWHTRRDFARPQVKQEGRLESGGCNDREMREEGKHVWPQREREAVVVAAMVRCLKGNERARQEQCMCVCVWERACGRAGWSARTNLESGQRSVERRQWKTTRESGGGLDILSESILRRVSGVSLSRKFFFSVIINSLNSRWSQPLCDYLLNQVAHLMGTHFSFFSPSFLPLMLTYSLCSAKTS